MVMICDICKRNFKNRWGLAIHVSTHGFSVKQYYDQFLKKDSKEGICKKCYSETRFNGISKGYSGHCSYRCSNSNLEVKNKKEKTYLERYGAINPFKSVRIIEKIKKAMFEKYGVEHALQSEEIQEKFKQTCLKNFGVEYPTQRSGHSIYANSFVKSPSKPQIKLYNLTKEIYSETEIEYWLNDLHYRLDIAIPSLKMAIEYDGSYYHQDKEKDAKRQLEIEKRGWKVIRYRDYVPNKEQLSGDINTRLKEKSFV